MSFRHSTVVLIETSPKVVRACHGIGELLSAPSVEIPARVGVRPRARQTNGGVAANDNVMANGVSKQPLKLRNGLELEEPPAFTQQLSQQSSYKVADYLVGTTLDEALANGEELEVFWPFENGSISDWVQAEAIWKYVLFKRLQIRRIQNESPVILAIQPTLHRRTLERLTQLFFERFNVAAFTIIERPLAQLYAANATTGITIEIDHENTYIVPIVDALILHNAIVTIPIGISDCERYLAHLLRYHISKTFSQLPPEQAEEEVVKLAKQIWREEGLVKIPADGETAEPEEEGLTNVAAVLIAGKEKAAIEAGNKKKAAAQRNAAERERDKERAALDLVEVQFGEIKLDVGKERHRFCEPLFDPSLLAGVSGVRTDRGSILPLQEGIQAAMSRVDIWRRRDVWSTVFVNGDLGALKGLGLALQARLSPYLLSSALSDAEAYSNDSQPKTATVVRVPEYFANYRDKGEQLATFLGLSIVGKIVYVDGSARNYVSKPDYASNGPRMILENVPTLL